MNDVVLSCRISAASAGLRDDRHRKHKENQVLRFTNETEIRTRFEDDEFLLLASARISRNAATPGRESVLKIDIMRKRAGAYYKTVKTLPFASRDKYKSMSSASEHSEERSDPRTRMRPNRLVMIDRIQHI